MSVHEDGAESLRTLITADPDGLLVVGPEDRVIRFANPAAAALLGRPGVDLCGELLPAAIAAGERVDLTVSRTDGTDCCIELTGRAFDWDGAPACLVTVHDVTEARRLGRAHAELAERERSLRATAAEGERRKDEYLAMLAHELRNPLAPLRTALYMLHKPDTRPVHQAWAWDVVERQMRHLRELVDGLIDVARLSHGRVPLKRARLDLAALTRGCFDVVRAQYVDRQQDWVLEVPEQPVRVEGDALRLEQAIEELLDNAAKYTESGGRIEVRVCHDGPDAVLEVQDTGAGIAPRLLPRIFNLFEQADRPLDRSAGGLGIGLTLVRRLVELHGGTVSATSQGPGQGSRFAFRLPALYDDPAPTEADSPRRRKVLVVDDNRDLAESLAMVLKLWGHDVRLAFDGPEAVSAAREQQPEVVFLDIGLPGLDGYEVARRLRGPLGMTAARVVAITGYGREEDRRRSRDAGFDLHLTKPVDPDVLKKLLAEPEAATSME